MLALFRERGQTVLTMQVKLQSQTETESAASRASVPAATSVPEFHREARVAASFQNNMKPLIETTSELYRKRLVRELNALLDGFYAPVATFNVRCNKAKLMGGVICCHSVSCSPSWFFPSREQFADVYSREVCASRKA